MNKRESYSKAILRASIKKRIMSLVSILFLSLIITVLSAVNPIIYQRAADEFIPGKNLRALIICICVTVAVPIIAALITLLKNKLNYWFGKKCIYDVTDEVFKKTLRSNYARYSQYDSVTLSNILTRSAEAIPSLYLNSIINTFASIAQFAVVFIMLLRYNAFLTFIVLAFLPISYLIIKTQKKRMREASHAGLVEQRNFQKTIVQIFNGMKTIRSYNAYDNVEKAFETGLERFNNSEWIFRKNECLAGDVLPTAASQIVIGVAFAVGAIFVVKDKMSVGTLIAIIAYLPSLVSSLNGIMKAKLSIGSIENTLKDFDDILSVDNEPLTNILPDKNAENIFTFENVDFSYGRENFNLHIDDLKVKKGEFVAVVGASGGGKSALTDILNKFFTIMSGSVRTFNRDINEIDTDSLRKMYSVVSQDVFLFNDTIEKNISFPETPDPERISDVIKKAQLTDFIKSLPEHEKTIINDFGANISGGEAQRISLARALYRNAPVMLLDEPTSALDSETSKKIFEMILSENKENGRTIVMITHDIRKTLSADKVAVISDGAISEYDSPDSLLRKGGDYKSLFEAQSHVAEKQK